MVSILFVILFSHMSLLLFNDGVFLKHIGLPVSVTWFMSQKTFDFKKPYGFLKSIPSYFLRSKLTYAYKPIKLNVQNLNFPITIVRSELYEYPIIYIENKLVFDHDGAYFAYYELIPYNYSFLSPEEKFQMHDSFR